MSDDKSNLKDDLIKIIIDRLLIGAIIVGLGYLSSILIEDYKSKLSFTDTINEKRVDRISKVWESIYLYESTHRRFINKFMKFVDDAPNLDRDRRKAIQDELKLINNEVDSLYNSMAYSIAINRFWIGNTYYDALKSYADSTGVYISQISRYTEAGQSQKVDSLRELQEGIQRDILEINESILNK